MLATIVLADVRKDQYAIYEHNLAPEEAKAEVARLRKEGKPAFTLQQKQRHGSEAEECDACRRNLQRAMAEGEAKARAMVSRSDAQVDAKLDAALAALPHAKEIKLKPSRSAIEAALAQARTELKKELQLAVDLAAEVEGVSKKKAREAIEGSSLDDLPEAGQHPDVNHAYGYVMGMKRVLALVAQAPVSGERIKETKK